MSRGGAFDVTGTPLTVFQSVDQDLCKLFGDRDQIDWTSTKKLILRYPRKKEVATRIITFAKTVLRKREDSSSSENVNEKMRKFWPKLIEQGPSIFSSVSATAEEEYAALLACEVRRCWQLLKALNVKIDEDQKHILNKVAHEWVKARKPGFVQDINTEGRTYWL